MCQAIYKRVPRGFLTRVWGRVCRVEAVVIEHMQRLWAGARTAKFGPLTPSDPGGSGTFWDCARAMLGRETLDFSDDQPQETSVCLQWTFQRQIGAVIGDPIGAALAELGVVRHGAKRHHPRARGFS